MVMPIEEPTLKEIKDSIELKIGKVELDLRDLRELVSALKTIIERLETISETIKERTDGLPKGFTRGGQYKAR